MRFSPAAALLAASLAAPLLLAPSSASAVVVGRVRVTPSNTAEAAELEVVEARLEARFAPAAGGFAPTRLVSVGFHPKAAGKFLARIWDYASERGFDLVVDAAGTELSRSVVSGDVGLTEAEYAEAATLVAKSPDFAPKLASPEGKLYEPMPPISSDADGRRLVNVGYLYRKPNAAQPIESEVVSVDLAAGKLVRYPSGAPPTSLANLLACGPPTSSCGAAVGACSSSWRVDWPAAAPVWSFDVWHPKCSQSVQSDATGIEIQNAYYRGRLVFTRADIPVLNVKYDADACGPYRDWLWSENCFQATGTTVAPGVLVTNGTKPQTACEAGSDAGNFKGLAIHDEGTSLWLVSEMDAGWYRYSAEWRFHEDGTIEPVMAFSAVENSCVCNLHHHHSYWRIEWALDGTVGSTTNGITSLARRRPGTTDQWDPVAVEGKFVRPVADPASDAFRIRNETTGFEYVIEPGAHDGTASGDSYSIGDVWGLALNAGQIDDPNGDTRIAIDGWANGEALGATKRLVTWYRAGFDHDVNALTENGLYIAEECHQVGPRIRTLSCGGRPVLDRAAYACGLPVGISLEDSDLVGTGTLAVAARSQSEPTPENVLLVENPAGSGKFSGSIATSNGSPVAGDGILTVHPPDVVTVAYLDASACGLANQTVEKSAAVDCLAPQISGVSASAITGSSARIGWTTNEPASSTVLAGTTPPGLSPTSVDESVTNHAVDLAGLAPCTVHWYGVRSADAAGNLAKADDGGRGFWFRTLANSTASRPSTASPVPIPDNNPAGASMPIAVADTLTIVDLDVVVNLTHTYDGDLQLSLVTPWGASIPLSTRRGGAGDDFGGTRFDDEAPGPISGGSAPFSGSFRPESPLSAVDGQSSKGTWQLKVVDTAAVDTGTIDSWRLEFTFVPVPCSNPSGTPPVPDGSTGTATKLRKSGTDAILFEWDAATCPSPGYHILLGSLDQVASAAPVSARCALPGAGAAIWPSESKGGSFWYLVVGDDGGSVEGSWGRNSDGGPIGSGVSGLCGLSSRVELACP